MKNINNWSNFEVDIESTIRIINEYISALEQQNISNSDINKYNPPFYILFDKVYRCSYRIRGTGSVQMPLEICNIQLSNASNAEVDLSIYSYNEWLYLVRRIASNKSNDFYFRWNGATFKIYQEDPDKGLSIITRITSDKEL